MPNFLKADALTTCVVLSIKSSYPIPPGTGVGPAVSLVETELERPNLEYNSFDLKSY